jgi:hypothetical protein
MPTLNKVFLDVFGEALTPLGFKRIKSKYPYFVRVVEGGEIIHVVTCTKETTGAQGIGGFNIVGGVATVYRPLINLELNPRNNVNWLMGNGGFYWKMNLFNDNAIPSFNDSPCFTYIEDKEKTANYAPEYLKQHYNNIIEALDFSLEATKKVMLPLLNAVTNLDLCIEYFYQFMQPILRLYDEEEFGKRYIESEGLLLIKTNNRDDGIERMEKSFARTAQFMKEGKIGGTFNDFKKECERIRQSRIKQISIRDKLLDDPEWSTKVTTELKRRKELNTKMLRSYGLDI